MTATRVVRLESGEVAAGRIEEIAKVLREGGIIAYPTETVYGLGADAFNPKGTRRLFEIKSRPPDKPISVLVRDAAMLHRVVSRVPPAAHALMEKYWPGPLTLILPASRRIPPFLTGQTGTIGVRISPHPFVRLLFGTFDSPLTSTSANVSGGESLMEPEDILRTFGADIDLIIDMPGHMEGGGSTVIDVTGRTPKVVRQGIVSVEGL